MYLAYFIYYIYLSVEDTIEQQMTIDEAFPKVHIMEAAPSEHSITKDTSPAWKNKNIA